MRIRLELLSNQTIMSLFPLPFLLCALTGAGFCNEWPGYAKKAEIQSTYDGIPQSAYYWFPQDPAGPVPLLVGLHSWSADYRQSDPGIEYLEECRKRGWAFIHPNFRGPNTNPNACGSEAALQDIRDAVSWMEDQTKIDLARVYAIGSSGGGHAALMAASRWPDLWAAVSAWVPPTDLPAWYGQTKSKDLRYWKHLTQVCGGPPGESKSIDDEYKQRSPIYQLQRAKSIPIEIAAGIRDGHNGSVPVSHTLRAFNVLACTNGFENRVIANEDIDEIVRTAKIPAELNHGSLSDPIYAKQVLFRRSAGPVRVTLFDGGHEILVPAAIAWVERHTKNRR